MKQSHDFKHTASSGSPTPTGSRSSTPETDAIRREYERIGVVAECALAYCGNFEKMLRKFMALTECNENGLTQMATIEGRVKFYQSLRKVRIEAAKILSENVRDDLPLTKTTETNEN